MIELKVKIKEDSEDHVDVKMITPKDVEKATQHEKNTARYIVEKMEEIFNGKKEEE